MWSHCCGIIAVGSLVWNHCSGIVACGIIAVESLSGKICEASRRISRELGSIWGCIWSIRRHPAGTHRSRRHPQAPRRHPGGPHEAQEVREVKYHKSGSPLSPNTILNKTPQSYKAFLRVTSIMTAYFCGNLAPVLWPQEYHTSSLLIKTARIPSAKAVWGIKTQFPFCLLMMC